MTIASLAVAASLAVPAAATAASGWSKPVTVLPAGNLAYQPEIATAADGTTIVVWNQYDSLKNTYSLFAATRSPQGKITKSKLGPAVNALARPALAVGGDGTFAVAWAYGANGSGGSLAVRIRARGAKDFGPTMKVSPANLSTDYGSGDAPSIAVDDAGTVYVAWEGEYSSSGGRHTQVVETQRAKGAHAWISPVRLSASGTDSHGARIAADGKGNAAVSWAEADSSVWASVTSGGRFGAAQRISGVTYESSPPSIAIGRAGKAAMLWEESGKGNSHGIAGKVFPGTTKLLSGKALSRYQTLAVASNGTGVGAWEEEALGGWEIAAAGLSGSSWSSGTRLNATGYAATFGVAPVSAANNQRAVVAWSEKDVQHASFVGARVRVGNRWQKAVSFPGLSAPVVSVPNDPVKSGPVAGALLWLSTNGLQISILK